MEATKNNETTQLGAVNTRFLRGSKMILDKQIPVNVVCKAGDYVQIDKGNDDWAYVHYSRLS
jgi:hypothetical protein